MPCYKKYIYAFLAFLAFSLASSLASLLWYEKIFLVSILTICNKTNYLGGNYSREETIQRRKLVSKEASKGRKLVSKKASKGRKLFKGGNYIRADTIQGNTSSKEIRSLTYKIRSHELTRSISHLNSLSLN